METIRFSFNNGEVNTVYGSATLISKLSEKFPQIFSQDRLAYHLEDLNECVPDSSYHSVCLGYETDEITGLLDLELLQDQLITFNDSLEDECWDEVIKVFIKSFGDKTYLWVRFFYY